MKASPVDPGPVYRQIEEAGRLNTKPALRLQRRYVFARDDEQAPFSRVAARVDSWPGTRPKLHLLLLWLLSSDYAGGRTTNKSEQVATPFQAIAEAAGTASPEPTTGVGDDADLIERGPFKTTRKLTDWVGLLGRDPNSPSDRRKVVNDLGWLKEQGFIEGGSPIRAPEDGKNGLVTRVPMTLLDPAEPGSPFQSLGDLGEGSGGYFTLPKTLVTNGWLAWLPVPALHLLLVLAQHDELSDAPFFLSSEKRSARKFLPSDEDYAAAGITLQASGLATVNHPVRALGKAREFILRRKGLEQQAPDRPLTLREGRERVRIHGSNGLQPQLEALGLEPDWPTGPTG